MKKYILCKEWNRKYVVKVEQLSNFDPINPDDCEKYENDDYDKCVDDELQKIWKPLINCNPPWLSSEDQCDGVMNISQEKADSVWANTFDNLCGIRDLITYPAKERCKKPCFVSQSNLFLGEKHDGHGFLF